MKDDALSTTAARTHRTDSMVTPYRHCQTADDQPSLFSPVRNLIVEEKSFGPCEELRYGRFSFKGFNPEVEKLMLLMNPRDETETKDEEDVSRMQTDVTDEEMALRYESLVESMKKKFAKKRERAAPEEEEDVNHNAVETTTKRKFLKPQD
ncbi:M-phase phosphoprotein 6-like [Sander lucioperca]|uniref:M-phase phosphoprotein 6-like n=1 Tax=Sander lucioperca TaxID=283035 RepID=UPI001653B446|nr:M-phase phosphoprotein 6-like [Sander lucioperca]